MNKVIDKGFRSCRFVSTIVKHPVFTVCNKLLFVDLEQEVITTNASTEDADSWDRFFIAVFPQELKVLSLEELEAGMLRTPAARQESRRNRCKTSGLFQLNI